MGDWEKFNETSLLKKEDFYSHLNIKDITDADYKYAKRVCKDFEIKKLGEYHDLYVQYLYLYIYIYIYINIYIYIYIYIYINIYIF